MTERLSRLTLTRDAHAVPMLTRDRMMGVGRPTAASYVGVALPGMVVLALIGSPSVYMGGPPPPPLWPNAPLLLPTALGLVVHHLTRGVAGALVALALSWLGTLAAVFCPAFVLIAINLGR